jgi:RNA polymerase sigma-70 factor (ECF subfamily)
MEDATRIAQPNDDESSVELALRARRGDVDAMERLYRQQQPRLSRWAHGRLPRWARDVVDTDDLVQETLLQTLRRMDTFEPRHGGALQAYLRRALDNRIRDEIRKVRRRPRGSSLEHEEHRDPAASPLEEAIGEQALHRYEAALSRLSEDEQALVLARIELGLGYQEIARETNRPSPDAARMAVRRALVRLASEMDDE